MKVLFTTNIPSPYRIDFFNELSRYCDLTVAIERKKADDRKEEWTKFKNIQFNIIEMNGINVGKDTAFCPQIIKIVKNNDFDIIVVGGYSTPTGMLLIQYLRRHKISFILNCDGGMKKDIERKLIYRMKKYFISSATYWLSSGKITNEYLEHYGANKKYIYNYPFTSIRNSNIIKPILEDEKNKLKNTIGIKSKYVVITVGSFIHRKGFDILIRAAQYIKVDVEVIIIGDKPSKEYIDIIKELNVKNVKFVDFMNKEDLELYYQVADIFVLPTREDIWGLVVNEAMAKGLPIITTNKCGAGLELIKDEENGYMVPVEDYKAIAEKINLIIEDEKLKEKMIFNNINKIKAYTIENMARQHYNIFQEIIEKENSK